jgi:hypothetical protein
MAPLNEMEKFVFDFDLYDFDLNTGYSLILILYIPTGAVAN